jgi:hypothetical protein
MNRNPYEPPAAQVDAADGTPVEIRRARLWLIGYSILILPSLSITTLPLGLAEAPFCVLILLTLALFIWQTGQGRNWARISMIIVYLGTALLTVRVLTHEPITSILTLLIPLLQLAFGGIGTYLLLTARSRSWFR